MASLPVARSSSWSFRPHSKRVVDAQGNFSLELSTELFLKSSERRLILHSQYHREGFLGQSATSARTGNTRPLHHFLPHSPKSKVETDTEQVQ